MIDDLPPYPEMRDSGVGWLGEVPAHWDVVRAKAVFDTIDRRSSTGEEELLTVSSKHGVVRRADSTVTMFKAESYVGHKLCWPGDLVVNSLWAWANGLGFAREHGLVSSAYSVYRPKAEKSAYADYWNRLLRSEVYNWEFTTRSKGVWISRLQLLDAAFMAMPVIVPPSNEQAAIVRFLAEADRRIGAYVAAKLKLVTLLEEAKAAIVHRAVTRGLDPVAPMKPSGVPWLGDVPAHWEVVPLKRVARFKSGAGFPVEKQGGVGEIPFYKVSDMNLAGNGREMLACTNALDVALASDLGATIFPRHAIIFPKVGGALLTNKRRILTKPSCIDNNVMACVLTQGILDFMFLRLQTLDFGTLSKPGPVPAIGEGEVREIKIALPPENEQIKIVQHVDAQTATLDKAIAIARAEIELLREYRTRLIADVVTGKRDVRAAAAALPDIADDTPLPDALAGDAEEAEDEVEDAEAA